MYYSDWCTLLEKPPGDLVFSFSRNRWLFCTNNLNLKVKQFTIISHTASIKIIKIKRTHKENQIKISFVKTTIVEQILQCGASLNYTAEIYIWCSCEDYEWIMRGLWMYCEYLISPMYSKKWHYMSYHVNPYQWIITLNFL